MAKPKDRVLDIVDMQKVLDFKEKLVDEPLRRTELTLNSRINEVKNDLKQEIEQLKKDLQENLQSEVSSLRWFIGLFITGGVAITGIIVTLIVALMK